MSIIADLSEKCAKIAGFFRRRSGAVLLFAISCTICAFAFSPSFTSADIVEVGGKTHKIITVRSNPEDIIEQAGLSLHKDDELVESVPNEDGYTEISIYRAFDVTVTEAGQTYTVTMTEGTVADAITEAGVALPDNDDIVSHALTDEVYPYLAITIDRVSYTESTSTERIRFKTVKVETDKLFKGTTRMAKEGEYGEKIVTSRTMFVNGIAQTTEVISEVVVRDPINEVIEVGTADSLTTAAPKTQKTEAQPAAAKPDNSKEAKEAKNTKASTTKTKKPTTTTTSPKVEPGDGKEFIDANGRAVSYSKKLVGRGTAYNEPAGSLTSTGHTVEEGIVAVDPKVIPYGTRLYIASTDGRYVYGYAMAGDTGGALRSGKVLVDLFYDTESECVAFGSREVVVYVLD